MRGEPNKKLSTEPYKGVRDFYPEDLALRSYLFSAMRETAERFGYAEYDASVLEPAELYRSKTSEEIVNEQSYLFTDRGGREVMLRPEMTPTVSRMIAARWRELAFPVRWYSIPNLFRYERPQRGRLREHWQLNVDIFGAETVAADAEIISVADALLRALGAKPSDYTIRVNSRNLLNTLFADELSLDEHGTRALSRLIDRKSKLPREKFQVALHDMLGNGKAALVERFLEADSFERAVGELAEQYADSEGVAELRTLFSALAAGGVSSARFDPTIVRGFDYYTGIVFEVFDTDPENPRSLFGGGRYDGLTALFGEEDIPAVGFGAGDVTIAAFLKNRGLAPAYESCTDLFVCVAGAEHLPAAERLARALRAKGAKVEVNLRDTKVGEQVRLASKKHIPFVLCIGERETAGGAYTLKALATSEETELAEDALADFLVARRTSRTAH